MNHWLARGVVPLLLSWAPIAAQSLHAPAPSIDVKPEPSPDPVKGWHEVSPLTDAERAMVRPVSKPHADGPVARQVLGEGPALDLDGVLFDQPGDGRIWGVASTYKCSFGADGFVYIPFLGSDAPRCYPVKFVVRSVRVGGGDVPFDRSAAPVLEGSRVTFDRGGVREVYDLSLDGVEQTFVVESGTAGDVEVELEVVSELADDPAVEGIVFGNERGGVSYGAAYLVDGGDKRPIAACCDGSRLALHVPAPMRGSGAVVIDPIISTSSTGWPITTNVERSHPDIAYDASTDRYMMVHTHAFSATDHDIYAEMRDGNGAFVPGSLTLIDVTTLNHNFPRVANLNSIDRFLVVTERFEAGAAAGQRYKIYGRAQNAAAPYSRTPQFQVSSGAGDKYLPDVGGDTGNGVEWAVVYVRDFSSADWDIHLQMVNAGGTLTSAPQPIENSRGTLHTNPQISNSNGNGIANAPRWLIVYSFRFSPSDWDVFGASIDQLGRIVQPGRPIDTLATIDVFPYVSSPATDWSAGNARFLVTYERQTPVPAAMAKVVDGNVATVVPATNLTQRFGFGPLWVRNECDGNRFAVIHGQAVVPNPPLTPTIFITRVSTIVVVNNAFVLQDSGQTLQVPGILGMPTNADPVSPLIASKRSGGGSRTDYAVTFIARLVSPPRPWIAVYRGAAPTGGAVRRAIGCGPARIDVTGSWELGGSITLQVTGTSGPSGVLYGLPASIPLPFCPGCTLGVTGASTRGNPLTIPITTDPALVGATFSFQGYSLGGGTCLGSLALTDTIDVTLQ